MSVLALVVITVLAVICVALKWRRTSRTLFVISIIGFFAVGCGPIPAWLLGDLQSAYAVKPTIAWGNRNAIVLLGAGTVKIAQTRSIEPGIFSYPRIVEAVELYNDCLKTNTECKIIVSGGDTQHIGTSEAAAYGAVLARLGVKTTDVLLESNSMNTWQNAQFTSAMLRRYGADRVLLVSSGIHLQRGMLYFAHFGIEPIPVRADYLPAIRSLIPLSYNFAVADFALHEYIGIARYYLYNAMGWNSERTQPGQA